MKRLFVIVFPLLLGACTLIDDDLSVCDQQMVIDYELRLYTELSMQLETELTTEAEASVRKGLERWLAPVFTDKAKDVDLRFFSGLRDELRYQIQEEINDNRTSYTIKLPKENYMHLAVANIADDRQVRLLEGDHSETMMLRFPEAEELRPMKTGVFTARLPMVVTDTSQHFNVHLYMANAAVVLIIDTALCTDLVSMEGYMTGSACGFSLRDSVYAYDNHCRLQMERIPTAEQTQMLPRKSRFESIDAPLACFGTVSMPTRDEAASWTLVMRVTLTDNRHTTTTLTVEDPLKAGTLRILSCQMGENGKLEPTEEHEHEVGAAVELDWKDGGSHDIEL